MIVNFKRNPNDCNSEEDFDIIMALKGLVAQPYVLSASGGLIREMSGKSNYKKSCDGVMGREFCYSMELFDVGNVDYYWKRKVKNYEKVNSVNVLVFYLPARLWARQPVKSLKTAFGNHTDP